MHAGRARRVCKICTFVCSRVHARRESPVAIMVQTQCALSRPCTRGEPFRFARALFADEATPMHAGRAPTPPRIRDD